MDVHQKTVKLLTTSIYTSFVFLFVFTRAVYAIVLCSSVCPSQIVVVSKRLNVSHRKQRRTMAQGP